MMDTTPPSIDAARRCLIPLSPRFYHYAATRYATTALRQHAYAAMFLAVPPRHAKPLHDAIDIDD